MAFVAVGFAFLVSLPSCFAVALCSSLEVLGEFGSAVACDVVQHVVEDAIPVVWVVDFLQREQRLLFVVCLVPFGVADVCCPGSNCVVDVALFWCHFGACHVGLPFVWEWVFRCGTSMTVGATAGFPNGG